MRIVVVWICCVVGLLGALQVGCEGTPQTTEPVVTDGGADGGASGQTGFVLSWWEESGAFGLINSTNRQPRPQLGPASNDAVARYFDGRIYIVNRLTHDNIQVMDASTWQLVKQYSVGPRSNPQDIVVLNDQKAYVSRLASPRLLIVAPLTGKQLGEIDLSELAETDGTSCKQDADCDASLCLKGVCARDGLPELARMHLYDGKLFVLAQRLDRNKQFDAKDHGIIAVIDTATDKLIKTIPTQGRNPIQILPADGGKRIYVVQVGRWLRGQEPVLDGMIEAFDLDAMKSEGPIFTEQQLGGNLTSVALDLQSTPRRGFAIRSKELWQTELVSFAFGKEAIDKVLATSACVAQGACFGFFQLATNDRRELYLVDRNPKQPGLRVFSMDSGKELTDKPIDMGLPPASVLFFPPSP